MKDWTLWLFETGSVVNLILLFVLVLSDARGLQAKRLRRFVATTMGIILLVTVCAGLRVLLRP